MREGAPSPGANTWEMWGTPFMSPAEHSCCPRHSQAAARAPRPPPRGMSPGMARILLHPFQDGPRQVCVVQGLGQPRTRTGDCGPPCGPPGAGQAAAAVLPPRGQDQGVAQEVQAPCLVGSGPVPLGVGHLVLLLTCSLSSDKGSGRAAVHGSRDRNPVLDGCSTVTAEPPRGRGWRLTRMPHPGFKLSLSGGDPGALASPANLL